MAGWRNHKIVIPALSSAVIASLSSGRLCRRKVGEDRHAGLNEVTAVELRRYRTNITIAHVHARIAAW
jgi:hypothetical protein